MSIFSLILVHNIRNKFNYRGINYVSTIELAKVFIIYTRLVLKNNWKSLWGFISGAVENLKWQIHPKYYGDNERTVTGNRNARVHSKTTKTSHPLLSALTWFEIPHSANKLTSIWPTLFTNLPNYKMHSSANLVCLLGLPVKHHSFLIWKDYIV